MPQARTGHNWLGLGGDEDEDGGQEGWEVVESYWIFMRAGTIVDSMSTLAVMNEVEEFKKAAEW